MLKQYVIAIGGPLGSFEPLEAFFDHTPLDNASYIILQHLPENYRSIINDIVQRHSKLKVVESTEGAPIENDKVYYAPPSRHLTISDGTLHLVKRSGGANWAFNIFLESLADSENIRKAIAVFFSGIGIDGVKGAAAIKKAGGLVIVQTPENCEFSELSRHIIESGNADFVLLPEAMPAVIQGYINRAVQDKEPA